MAYFNKIETENTTSDAERDGEINPEQQTHLDVPGITVKDASEYSSANFDEPTVDAASISRHLSLQLPRASHPFQPPKFAGRRGVFNQMNFVQTLEKANFRREKWDKYTVEEVALHNRPDDAWVILKGKVYNIRPYLAYHPGGEEILLAVAGKDCTSEFNFYHPWVNAELLLDRLCLGVVVDAKLKK